MPHPHRGEIWLVRIPTDPPGKGLRPAVVISREERNQHPRADTVLVAPLSTTPPRSPTHIQLLPGETNLSETSSIRAENVTTVLKSDLIAPRTSLRLSNAKIRAIAAALLVAIGCEDML